MLKSNKNKLHELMKFHRGPQGGRGQPPLILEIYLVNHQLTLFFAYNLQMKQRVASM